MPLGPDAPFGGPIGGAFTCCTGAFMTCGGTFLGGAVFPPTGRAANFGGADLIGGGPLAGAFGFPKPIGGGLLGGAFPCAGPALGCRPPTGGAIVLLLAVIGGGLFTLCVGGACG